MNVGINDPTGRGHQVVLEDGTVLNAHWPLSFPSLHFALTLSFSLVVLLLGPALKDLGKLNKG